MFFRDSKLTERVETLEREVRALRGEWQDHYDRTQRQLWRIIKRTRDATAEELVESPAAAARSVDKVSQQILARRHAGHLHTG